MRLHKDLKYHVKPLDFEKKRHELEHQHRKEVQHLIVDEKHQSLNPETLESEE